MTNESIVKETTDSSIEYSIDGCVYSFFRASNTYYEYELEFEDTDYIEQVWNLFKKEYRPSSCISYNDDASVCGFKKTEDGYTYFPFGVVYRVDDIDCGRFYIGQTVSKSTWDGGYLGSGTLWSRHRAKYPEHNYKRSIILTASTPKEMLDREVEEISKYSIDKNGKKAVDHSTGCMNIDTGLHGANIVKCTECGGVNCIHYKTCSKSYRCPECGWINSHKRTCSHGILCEECGGGRGKYKKGCSKAKRCLECGTINGIHIKGCSRANICPECGGNHIHRAECSRGSRQICGECGGKNGKHRKVCPECGSKSRHKYGYSIGIMLRERTKKQNRSMN